MKVLRGAARLIRAEPTAAVPRIGDERRGARLNLGKEDQVIEENTNSSEIELVASFLVTEHSEIFQEFRRLRNEGLTRLNFYVTISTGVLGGLAFSFQLALFPVLVLQLMAVLSITMLVFLGWDAFRYLIARDIGTDFNMRAMARIRRFFIKVAPEVEDYLLWNTSDEPSHYLDKREGSLSTIAATMMYFVSMLVGFDFAIGLSILLDSLAIILLVGITISVLVYFALRLYALDRLQKARELAEENVRFPRDRPISRTTDRQVT
jgi:hypothetical protein